MTKRMRVLIGYDGSSDADTAVDDLRRAGLPNDVEALVVSVEDTPTVPEFVSHEVVEKAFVGDRAVSIIYHANKHEWDALEQAKELALSAIVRLKSYFPNWQVHGEVLPGTPASELIRRAEEWEAQLLVVGSQGRSAIGRLILGSVSLEVATEARCSVRIGRRRRAESDRRDLRIIVGLDSSPGAERAIRKVLMRPWPKGTELRIVAVDDGISSIKFDLAPISELHVRQDSSVTASRMIKLAESRRFTVSAGIKKGDPQRLLIAESREWEADCIIIGPRGTRNKLQGLFDSSVSTGLAADAECSVEIVR